MHPVSLAHQLCSQQHCFRSLNCSISAPASPASFSPDTCQLWSECNKDQEHSKYLPNMRASQNIKYLPNMRASQKITPTIHESGGNHATERSMESARQRMHIAMASIAFSKCNYKISKNVLKYVPHTHFLAQIAPLPLEEIVFPGWPTGCVWSERVFKFRHCA